jgi:hypothetical protein
MSLTTRSARTVAAALGALALVLGLLVATTLPAHADVATSCANRNANSLKVPPRALTGEGESVKTVCPTAQSTPNESPVPENVAALIPTSIPAGSGPGMPIDLAPALIAASGAIALRRLVIARQH